MMYTPRFPVKRRLFFTPGSTGKRSRATPKTSTARVQQLNRRTTRGPKTTGTLTSQVKSLQRIVKSLAPEVKYLDTVLDSVNVPNTGTVVHITPVAQGVTQGTRVGNTINVSSILCTGFWSRNTTDPDVNALHRIAIVVDKEQVADTAPTAGDIFTSPAEPTFGAPNLANLERFRILYLSPIYDAQMMVLDSDNVATNSPSMRNTFEWSWKGNLKVSFNGANGTDMDKNNVYIVFLSNDTVSDFDGTARIAFTDV